MGVREYGQMDQLTPRRENGWKIKKGENMQKEQFSEWGWGEEWRQV